MWNDEDVGKIAIMKAIIYRINKEEEINMSTKLNRLYNKWQYNIM